MLVLGGIGMMSCHIESILEVVQVKTQGCRLDDKRRVHDRLARRIRSL